jgi:hypothetical protein
MRITRLLAGHIKWRHDGSFATLLLPQDRNKTGLYQLIGRDMRLQVMQLASKMVT